MKTNQTGIDLIKHFEGFSAEPYLCPAGKLTIGYGHVIDTKSQYMSINQDITEEQAEEILRNDLQVAEKAVEWFIEKPLNENQFAALVSFTFNLGSGALEDSTLCRKLNDGQYDSVPGELQKWVYAKGKKLPGLVARRAAEAELFQREV